MTTSPIATCLWFDGQAEEVAAFYTSLLPDSRITNVARLSPDGPAILVDFTIAGTRFQALNGGPEFQHCEAASISITTTTQAETDRLWDALVADGGEPSMCGWLKDRFGVSWQVVPAVVPKLLFSADPVASARAMQAIHTMRKLDIAALEAAYRGA